jgi:anhydro-N-acetylmuramic acid kinase
MDAWCQAHTGAPFDDAGRWAASGQVHASLLARMQSEPFFHQPPPKSTGRDLFHLAWLDQHLTGLDAIPAQDVQATLAELTAWSCAQALNELWKHCDQLIVCGGGALNLHEMARLQALLPGSEVLSSAARGLPPLQVEATAFAWLARQAILRKPSSVPSVTGAKGARILGAIYPA